MSGLCLAVVAIAGCARDQSNEPPERATDTIAVEPQSSLIAVPVTTSISGLVAALEREVPRTLWSIDQPDQECVASRRIKVAFVKLKTPTIKCRIVGKVTRGRLSLSGRGRDIVVTMPINAVVRAQDIGGILKQETATGSAKVRAIAHLSLNSDWTPRGTIDIAYDWTEEPGIDFLGRRIRFTSKADARLAGVIAHLERTLPRELGKLHLRPQIEQAWRKAFTSLELNHANPPVWMRITPQELHYGGYALKGSTLSFNLGMKALTETFVGDRPPDPPATALPPVRPLAGPAGKLTFFIPVIADYAQLEPVVKEALEKRAAQPFEVPNIGPVDARFGTVTIYGAKGGQIAVGVEFTARDRADRVGKAKGTVWLTGTPVNAADSRRVAFSDLQVRGSSDRAGTGLLIALANTPAMSLTISEALAQNFDKDYSELLDKIGRAIAEKREGELLIRAHIENVTTGQLRAAGQGVYLLVRGTGTASIRIAPR